MGRGDNRKKLKARQRKEQARKKARVKRQIETAKKKK